MDHWMNFSVGSSACHIAVSQIVVWLFNDFKLHGRLGRAYTVQFYFTEEESNFLICVVVQPLNSSLMLLTSVFYHPYNYIRRFAGCIGYQLAEMIVVGVL